MARKFLTSVDLNKNELQNARIHNLATPPASPVVGQLYLDINVTPNRLYYWTGSAWANHATDSDLLGGQNSAFHRARGNHTGTQTASTISDFDTQVRTNRLDQLAAPTAAVGMNSQRLTGLGTPSLDGDAATKAYVDAASQGLDIKASVRAATTGVIALAGTQTIDGVAVVAGDRVLVKEQATPADNGIYVASVGTWARSPDADTASEITPGMFTFVEEGTVNADTGWVLTTNAPITLGSTGLVFTQFSGGGTVTAGAGLTKTGNTLDVGAGNGLVVEPDLVRIDTAVVSRKYAADLGDGAALSYVLTHNLGTRDIQVSLRDNTSPFAFFEADYEATSVNTATLRFAAAPTANQYRAIIHG